MGNVWKIGSRWSPNGSYESRIISIFRRSEAVFLGNDDSERFNQEVKEGDYFAIADGYCIPAVAKAISNPMPLNDMIAKKIIKVREKDPFDISEDFSGCYGVKVKIVDLPPKDIIQYKKMGAFCKAISIANEVVKLYEDNLSRQFDIQTHIYRIKSITNSNDGKRAIIDRCTVFNIPVYQREYSWEEEQIRRFVGDIFKGFWGSEDEKYIIKEPMFIGTMQLSYKKYIIKDEYEQDVIDGQQRLSTILCIIKYLQLKYKQNDIISKLDLNWLETRVNNGKEDDYLRQVLALDSLDAIMNEQDLECNRYLKNIQIIKEVFEEETTDEEGNILVLFRDNLDSFIEYFLSDIYFVVVETLAGLSKTIQIFNTINTAGLDLNGNDLFKVRLYEYLHDKKGCGEETFYEIGEIYKDVKDINNEWRKNHNWDIISIELVRSIYKDYIISKYKLSTGLYDKSTDTFFEELFDTLLNVKSHRDMNGVRGKEISLFLEDLKRIIRVVLLWGKSEFKTYDEFISYTLIERSRYSRYTNIAYQILLSNESLSEKERFSQVYECFNWLSKLFFCYSIMYAKAINEIHSFMHSVYRSIYDCQSQKDSLLFSIKTKLNEINSENIKYHFGKPIADKSKWKNLVCILSDYLDELENKTSIPELQQLYSGNFDIEHIHANGNEEEGLDIDEELQNSIGNLMLLECDINRSIGHLPFREKKDRQDGKLCYKHSKYATVKRIRTFNKWELEQVKQRHESEVERIYNFLFGDL